MGQGLKVFIGYKVKYMVTSVVYASFSIFFFHPPPFLSLSFLFFFRFSWFALCTLSLLKSMIDFFPHIQIFQIGDGDGMVFAWVSGIMTTTLSPNVAAATDRMLDAERKKPCRRLWRRTVDARARRRRRWQRLQFLVIVRSFGEIIHCGCPCASCSDRRRRC